MSNQIFKSITNAIAFNEKNLSTPDYVFFGMFPHLRELALNKVEIFKKLIELVGDKDNKYYEEFYNNNFKDFKLKQIYTFNEVLCKRRLNSFSDSNQKATSVSKQDKVPPFSAAEINNAI